MIWITYERPNDDIEAPASDLHSPGLEGVTLTGTVAMNKNLTIKMGNCNHRHYMPLLIEAVRSGRADPTAILSHTGALANAIEAYQAFDRREAGWTKVELQPAGPNGQRPSASAVV